MITAEKMQQKDLRNATNKDLTAVAASRQQILQNLKDMAKAQKDLINYKEYVQVYTYLLHLPIFQIKFIFECFIVLLRF